MLLLFFQLQAFYLRIIFFTVIFFFISLHNPCPHKERAHGDDIITMCSLFLKNKCINCFYQIDHIGTRY